MAATILSPISPDRCAVAGSSSRAQENLRSRRLRPLLLVTAASALCVNMIAHASRIKTTSPPIMVELTLGSVHDAIGPRDSLERAEIIASLAGQIVAQAQANPQRLLALRLVDASLTFDGATREIQREIQSAKGSRSFATAAYETAVASLLADIIAAAEQQAGSEIPLSVMGLPVEGSSRLDASAKSVNARYRAVLNQSDAFISARSVVVSGGSTSELMTLKTSLSESFRLANGRPIIYRRGNEWRLVTTSASPTIKAMVQPISSSAAIEALPPKPVATSSSGLGKHAASSTSIELPVQGDSPPSIATALALPADAIEQLQGAWGTSNAQWDLNGDGIVGSSDLAILLAILGSNTDDAPDAAACFESDDTTIGPSYVDSSLSDPNTDGDDAPPGDDTGDPPPPLQGPGTILLQTTSSVRASTFRSPSAKPHRQVSTSFSRPGPW